MRVGLYPGSFDPVTHGHVDVVRRAAHLVDRLVIGVGVHPAKAPMFTGEELLRFVRRRGRVSAGETRPSRRKTGSTDQSAAGLET